MLSIRNQKRLGDLERAVEELRAKNKDLESRVKAIEARKPGRPKKKVDEAA